VVPDADSVAASPIITRREARQIALGAVNGPESGGLQTSDATLLIYNDGLVRGRAGESHLAWKVTVVGAGVREFVYVSAVDGSIIDQFSGVHSARNRLTFDMNGGSVYAAATLERTEGAPPTGDADVDDAHDFAGDSYDFYFNAYGRDSLDDAGFDLLSYTHYFNPFICPNAFWDGLRMTYCDGFPTDDVTAHELTHGVTEFTADLVYRDQPGALNESISDIFGEVVDQINGAGDDSEAVKWLVGEDLPVFGAIRDMSNPPAFGDPDHVTSPLYFCGPGDSGGVHTNSGVPNKNFFLLTEGGSFRGRVVNGMGLTKAAAIHYQALTNYLGVNTQFPGYFISLWRSCRDLIGVNLNDPITGAPSGEVLTLAECVDVLRAGAAVEFLSPACI
jgi:Zn-dependent metalloprotease